jgi:hypothetical protein
MNLPVANKKSKADPLLSGSRWLWVPFFNRYAPYERVHRERTYFTF